MFIILYLTQIRCYLILISNTLHTTAPGSKEEGQGYFNV